MLKIIRIFFLVLFILTSLIVLIDYPGSKLIYLIFSIISLFYFAKWRRCNESAWNYWNESNTKINGLNSTCYCGTICDKWYHICIKTSFLKYYFNNNNFCECRFFPACICRKYIPVLTFSPNSFIPSHVN